MKNKKRGLIILAAFLLCAAVCAGIYFLQGNGHQEKAQVTVRGKTYAGCGAIYAVDGTDGYIVSAGHIFADMQVGESCAVTFYDGTEGLAELLYVSDIADVAFLKTAEVVGEAVPVDKGRFDALKEGSEIFVCSGKEAHVEKISGVVVHPWIYLEDFSLNMLLVKLAVKSGMSGCAVYDEKGYFAGILCGTSTEGEAAVLPLSVIESEWSMIAPISH